MPKSPSPAPRFHYFRWHSHPLGWGVRDAKHDCVVALGDKSTCAMLAELMEGKPHGLTMADETLCDYEKSWDAYVAAGAPIWQPDTD